MADAENPLKQRIVALEEANRQLQKREETLKEVIRRKDEFLVLLAHELRNPLAPLRNALEVLKLSDGGSPIVVKSRALMERQVAQLSRMLDDLLDVSRLLSGKITICSERLDLARLVRIVAESHRPAFVQAGLELAAETPEVPIWVSGDATRLTQAIAQLLHNAGKFTDR